VLIIRRSNCINTASVIVFSVSDRPVCRLKRRSNYFNTASGIVFSVSDRPVPSQPAHRMVTYTKYYTRWRINTIYPELYQDARSAKHKIMAYVYSDCRIVSHKLERTWKEAVEA